MVSRSFQLFLRHNPSIQPQTKLLFNIINAKRKKKIISVRIFSIGLEEQSCFPSSSSSFPVDEREFRVLPLNPNDAVFNFRFYDPPTFKFPAFLTVLLPMGGGDSKRSVLGGTRAFFYLRSQYTKTTSFTCILFFLRTSIYSVIYLNAAYKAEKRSYYNFLNLKSNY